MHFVTSSAHKAVSYDIKPWWNCAVWRGQFKCYLLSAACY